MSENQDTKQCPKCGVENGKNCFFCKDCGASLREKPQQEVPPQVENTVTEEKENTFETVNNNYALHIYGLVSNDGIHRSIKKTPDGLSGVFV